MSREINKLLTDIEKSIGFIEHYLTLASTYAVFKNDVLIMDGVQRRLVIIGEALWKADKLNAALPIADKKKIISLRHILVHDYDLISDPVIRKICKEHLPILKAEVQSILNSTE